MIYTKDNALINDSFWVVFVAISAYLPFFGMLFRERFPVAKPTAEAQRPAAQSVIVRWIHHCFASADTAPLLAQRLGYTRMSPSHAFDELERFAKLAPTPVIERVGRERKAR